MVLFFVLNHVGSGTYKRDKRLKNSRSRIIQQNFNGEQYVHFYNKTRIGGGAQAVQELAEYSTLAWIVSELSSCSGEEGEKFEPGRWPLL
jgi:hypothetical protein